MNIVESLSQVPVVPVVVIQDVEKALPLADALLKGGMNVIEITFRTTAAEESIRRISEKYPEMMMGAGTLLTKEQVLSAQQAGAHFGVSPGFDPEIVAYAQSLGFVMLPGIATASELSRVIAMGCPIAKFFPAKQAGGPDMIKAILGAFRHTGIRFMPTGGINLSSVADYLSIPEVVALGGSWMVEAPLIQGEQWDEITKRAQEALAVAKEIKS